MKLTGSQLVAEILLEHGVDTVFGYPGGTALNLYDTLYEYRDKIRHILTAHEQGAAHAADGYSRATGKTGVVFATSGPGATNLVTGIATAFMDSIPMIAITANVPDSLIGRDAFQEICITGVTMPITKHTFFVNKIEDLADAVRNAFRIANSGRKGPVLIDITKDVTAAKIDYKPDAAQSTTGIQQGIRTGSGSYDQCSRTSDRLLRRRSRSIQGRSRAETAAGNCGHPGHIYTDGCRDPGI